MERRFQGQPVSSGIAMGRLRVEARGCSAPVIRTILPTEIEAEWQRFETALERTELEIKVLKTRVEELSGANEAAIFDAHLLFLRDRMIISRLRKEMPKRLQNIDSVYYAVVQNFMEAMRHVAYGDPKRLFSYRLDPVSQSRMGNACEAFLAAQLERGFRTLDFYKQLKL